MKISIIAVFIREEGTSPTVITQKVCYATINCALPSFWDKAVAGWLENEQKELGNSYEIKSISHAFLPRS